MERLRRLPGKSIAASLITLTVLFIIHHTFQPALLPYDISDTRWTEQCVRSSKWLPTSDYDIVVAYFNEDVKILSDTIHQVVKRLPLFSRHRVIVYAKNGDHTEEALKLLLPIADEVTWLENVGREGDTYLTHITRHYRNAAYDLAGHTIFIQPHLAWPHVLLPRLETLNPHIGFMSLGPYINQTAGKDIQGNVFPRMNDIYSVFMGEFSPPHSVLSTWAGQFVVSRNTILSNKLQNYQNLLQLFHAPPDHWIWKEGWWNNEPANPTLGHALERSWPVIFGCIDVALFEKCGERSGTGCWCPEPF